MTAAAVILQCPPCGAKLTLAGLSQHTGAWCAVNLDDLISGPDSRGAGIEVERLDGHVPKRSRPTATTYDLPYVFAGAVDPAGAAHTDRAAGLAINRRTFRSQIATGLVIAGQLEEDDGTVLAGQCVVYPRIAWETKPGALALAVVRIRIDRPWTAPT